jgi:UDP-N-acetylmuramyl pentapeptide phosphotransferase/UDP-N-acetylglucosamine-1-phosphate transferase
MVAFTNIINLIDGLDGLAAGIAFLSAVACFY